MVKMIMATKADLEDRRQVNRDWGEDLAMQMSVLFEETSAKLDSNVRGAAFSRARVHL